MTAELETIMRNIKVRSHIGADGILHLDIPVGVHDADLEVTVTVQPVEHQPAKTPEELGYPSDFFERTAGAIPDLERPPQGEYEVREPL